jgi:polyisoprenyl-phosphate glycosyltransferase
LQGRPTPIEALQRGSGRRIRRGAEIAQPLDCGDRIFRLGAAYANTNNRRRPDRGSANSGQRLRLRRPLGGRHNVNDEITSRVFWFVLSSVFKIDIVKHQLMMRGMTSRVARVYDSYPEATRTVAGVFQDLGFKSTVIEVENGRRVDSAGNYGFFKRLDLMIHMIISLTTAPLNILIYLSFIVLAATTLSSIYYLANAIFRTVPSGFTTIVLAVLFFGSLTMLVLGIIGIYLANIYTEVRRRPLFLVAEETDFHG